MSASGARVAFYALAGYPDDDLPVADLSGAIESYVERFRELRAAGVLPEGERVGRYLVRVPVG